jgi:hypothetical protein
VEIEKNARIAKETVSDNRWMMEMVNKTRGIILAVLLLPFVLSVPLVAQDNGREPYKSQEVSESDGIPVLIKHLPDWESVRTSTRFARSQDDLRSALGSHPMIDLVDFSGGTEAVTAEYEAGRLLIVEFASPQGSIDADEKFVAALAESGDGSTVYRRIGNYNAIVLGARDSNAATALLDQVKYEKDVHWLGDNPFIISAERAFVLTTSDVFLSTLKVILLGAGIAIVAGLIVGFAYFNLRDSRRARMTAFSDAGGMTRLNLDGYSADIFPKRLLKD